MERDSGIIYYNARRAAGLTQERFAEMIGCSPDSVRNYEAGTQVPGDDIVRAMCEISGMGILAYWHLCRKSTLAADMLPEVDRLPLPQAVVQLLCAIGDFDDNHRTLVKMAADGKISGDELEDFIFIQEELERISITVETLQLWSERMLATGVIDEEQYNACKKRRAEEAV